MPIPMSLNLPLRARCAPSRKFRLRGGAMLGLIAGVIIGLAVALGVAMYVAKVPIPFVNNVPVPNNAQDQKNSNWNPNAALQTRGPVLPASDAASSTQPGSAPQQQPVTVPPPVEVEPPAAPSPTDSAPEQQPRTAAQPAQTGNPEAPAGDVLGDFAAARTRAADSRNNSSSSTSASASPSPSPVAAEPAFIYYVQTGAFRNQQDADAERARLSLLGMEAAITERDQAGRVVYRVRVGPFQNKAAADQISSRLTGNGFEAALVRVPR